MIKIYEATGLNSATLATFYKGISIVLNFKNGDTTRKKWATLQTDNKLVQDAIEADERFGVTIQLKQTFKTEDDENQEEPKTEKKKSGKSKAKEAETEDKVFSSSNDAVRWLTEKGLYTGTENVAELIEEHNIKING